jgi:hypothetical protein
MNHRTVPLILDAIIRDLQHTCRQRARTLIFLPQAHIFFPETVALQLGH